MAHPDLNTLFDTVLSFAKLMLSEHGEFYPFGATMSPSGEITNVGARVKGEHHPRSQTLIDLITEAFQQKAASGQIRAAAICYDVRTIPPGETRKTDAVCCGLEHTARASPWTCSFPTRRRKTTIFTTVRFSRRRELLFSSSVHLFRQPL